MAQEHIKKVLEKESRTYWDEPLSAREIQKALSALGVMLTDASVYKALKQMEKYGEIESTNGRPRLYQLSDTERDSSTGAAID